MQFIKAATCSPRCVSFFMHKWLLPVDTILVLGETESIDMGPWSFFILHAEITGNYNKTSSEK